PFRPQRARAVRRERRRRPIDVADAKKAQPVRARPARDRLLVQLKDLELARPEHGRIERPRPRNVRGPQPIQEESTHRPAHCRAITIAATLAYTVSGTIPRETSCVLLSYGLPAMILAAYASPIAGNASSSPFVARFRSTRIRAG